MVFVQKLLGEALAQARASFAILVVDDNFINQKLLRVAKLLLLLVPSELCSLF